MSIESDKYKVHINELYDCTKEQALDYAFTKFYEYENNDIELADFFFNIIGKIVIGTYIGPDKNVHKIKVAESIKKTIVDVTYQYSYEDLHSVRGPLKNIFGELLDPNVEEPFIVPYMQLIQIMQYNKEKSSKIAN